MRWIPLLLVGSSLAGCAKDEPYWAIDPIFVEPVDSESIYALQEWQVYSKGWQHNQAKRHYQCAVIVELSGTPTDPCPDCTDAWEVTAQVLESDCTAGTASFAEFTSTQRIGMGGAASGDVPYPGQTRQGMVDYGFGWEPHGFAYHEALDAGRSSEVQEWDGEHSFMMWPTYAWDLAAGSLTAVSQSE